MAGLATVAAPHPCRRVRGRPASRTDDAKYTEPFRLLLAKGADPLRARAAQWRIAVASGLYPVGETEGMDRQSAERVPLRAFRPLDLPLRDGNYRRFVPGLR